MGMTELLSPLHASYCPTLSLLPRAHLHELCGGDEAGNEAELASEARHVGGCEARAVQQRCSSRRTHVHRLWGGRKT